MVVLSVLANGLCDLVAGPDILSYLIIISC